MHLEKVKGVSFNKEISEIHDSFEPNLLSLKENCALLIISLPPILGYVTYLLLASKWSGVLVGFLTFFVFLYAGNKIFSQGYYLPKSARQFYLTNKAEWNDLCNRVSQMNWTLHLQQKNQLLLPPAEQCDDTNLANYMQERCELLQVKVNDFVERFRIAVKDDLDRVEEKRRTDPKIIKSEFNKKVQQLTAMERRLQYMDRGSETTEDELAPFEATVRLRRHLEKERVRLGLPQEALPPRKKLPPLLKG